MSLDSEIDRLYQLPPDEFTAARNDLAKRAGPKAGDVRKLPKPPLAAWAVNQLHWNERKTYDDLIEAANALRAAHTAVLSGKRGDLRFAGKEHDEAIERALKRTLALLADAGHPVTDATRHAVAQTLRALPSDEPPGRLARTLSPGGFEMLAGITVKGRGPSGGAPKSAAARPAAKAATQAKPDAEDERRQARAREEAAAAAKALREAEHDARRAEFEAARAARAAARADEALADARATFDAARTRLAEAEADAKAAQKAQQAADRALGHAAHEVEVARTRAAAADRAVKKP
jgi:hypothetical protein